MPQEFNMNRRGAETQSLSNVELGSVGCKHLGGREGSLGGFDLYCLFNNADLFSINQLCVSAPLRFQ